MRLFSYFLYLIFLVTVVIVTKANLFINNAVNSQSELASDLFDRRKVTTAADT